MKTFEQFSAGLDGIPLRINWTLTELAEMKGRQELFTKQSPQKLKILRESAIIESAISSNRIEGVEIDRKRIGAVLKSKGQLNDRDEEEVRNYQDVLKTIHKAPSKIDISEKRILGFHAMTRRGIWDAGAYKEKPVDIIEKLPGGGERIRFRSVSPEETPEALSQLVERYADMIKEATISPLILLAAFNLDFLCIHPFRDGNGRVSRLLWLLQLYHHGFEVGRFISIERLIEANKDRYYETLQQSSQGWHEGKHDPWPYIGYVLFIVKTACAEFEERVGEIKSPRGSKTEMVKASIARRRDPFQVAEIQNDCPGVSLDLIRRVLKDLAEAGEAECLTRGREAKWVYKG